MLVTNQASAAANGVYTADTAAWSRDLDFDGAGDIVSGTLVFVTSGSANGSGLFQVTTADPITIGQTSLTITKIATLSPNVISQVNVQNGQFIEVASIAGTNTITGTTVGTPPAALGHGQYVFFVPANTNTGPATFNRDALGAINIFYNGAALIGGELQANIPALLFEDGTQYHLVGSANGSTNYQIRATIASATAVNLDTAPPYSQITGTAPITTITLGNGRIRYVEFAGVLVINNSAALVCVTGANIATAAGDTAAFVGEAGGVTRMLFYQRADGSASLAPQTIFSTGDVKLTIKTVADPGWVLMNDGTIGDAASGATTRANADTSALFILLWNNTANADCAVSFGRGGSAQADFAAHKTIALPKALGRALATYGSGAGLTTRAMASVAGTETETLTVAQIPGHTHGFTAVLCGNGIPGSGGSQGSGCGTSNTDGGTGGGQSHNNLGPRLHLNTMLKL